MFYMIIKNLALLIDNCTFIPTIDYLQKHTILPKISLKQLMCFHQKKKDVH